jgi:hypothetical protein
MTSPRAAEELLYLEVRNGTGGVGREQLVPRGPAAFCRRSGEGGGV